MAMKAGVSSCMNEILCGYRQRQGWEEKGVGCEPGARAQIFPFCHVVPTQNSEQWETSKLKLSLTGCSKGLFAKVN